ncbi:hypothetical protein MJK72_14535 [Klebsiella pneumoniae]|nr:hypothetical protein MJK72_14535 [Klebsiella pneumoniae]
MIRIAIVYNPARDVLGILCGVDGEHHAKKPDQRAYIQHFFGFKIRAVHHGENYPLDYRYVERK